MGKTWSAYAASKKVPLLDEKTLPIKKPKERPFKCMEVRVLELVETPVIFQTLPEGTVQQVEHPLAWLVNNSAWLYFKLAPWALSPCKENPNNKSRRSLRIRVQY